MSQKEIEEFIHYGSNAWLYEFKKTLENLIEERKNYTHEIYFLIFRSENETPEYKTMTYTSDPVSLLKSGGQKIFQLVDISYKKYSVYLRKFEDNETILLGKKMDKQLFEVSLDYFKLCR